MLNRFTNIPHKQFQNDHNEDFNRPHFYNTVMYNEYSGQTNQKIHKNPKNYRAKKFENDHKDTDSDFKRIQNDNKSCFHT